MAEPSPSSNTTASTAVTASVPSVSSPPLSYPFWRPYRVSVSATRNESEDGGKTKKFTVYIIFVQWFASSNSLSWTIERRFSEFEDLKRRLESLLRIVPPLPSKTFFRSFESNFIEQRRQALSLFLAAILEMEAAVRSDTFRQFLGVQHHMDGEGRPLQGRTQQPAAAATPAATPSLASVWDGIVPLEVKCVHDDQFGINDCIFLPSSLLLFLAGEDQSALSKLDSKFTNFRLSFTNKKTAPVPNASNTQSPATLDEKVNVPIGALSVWFVERISGLWKKKAQLFLSCECSSLAISLASRKIFAGLETGQVKVYSIESADEEVAAAAALAAAGGERKEGWNEIDDGDIDCQALTFLENLYFLHSDRITSLKWIEKHGTLVSVARDKCLSIFNYRKYRKQMQGRRGSGGLPPSAPAHRAPISAPPASSSSSSSASSAPSAAMVNAIIGADHVCFQVDSAWISSMVIDDEQNPRRAFIGLYNSNILIYDLSAVFAAIAADSDLSSSAPLPVPERLHVLSGHGGSIRSLALHAGAAAAALATQSASAFYYLFSGSFDNNAGIWEIFPYDNQSIRRSKSVGSLQSGPLSKIKAVHYHQKSSLVFCGHDNGVMTVHDTRSGQMKYAFHAHSSSITWIRSLDEKYAAKQSDVAADFLVSAAMDGKVKFFLLPNEKTLENKKPAMLGEEEKKREEESKNMPDKARRVLQGDGASPRGSGSVSPRRERKEEQKASAAPEPEPASVSEVEGDESQNMFGEGH